uniref:Uncharacterized protein n=1 Tax=Rousettus aegyptiacus TaxID=9407 RepID=A0A7J8C2R7_ROUAE|nr:hypothetical protein HJG63_009456 [Rousettus aegyptiacus]
MGLYPRCLGLIGGAGGSIIPGTVRYSLWLGQRLGVSGEDHAPVPLTITSPRGDGAWSLSRVWPHVATGMRTKEKRRNGKRARRGWSSGRTPGASSLSSSRAPNPRSHCRGDPEPICVPFPNAKH